jgi:hypothetical protein
MKTKHLTIFSLLILFCFNANAQEFKLGKVSIAELEQKVHPKDSTAVAAVLFEKGDVTFEYIKGEGFTMNTTVKTRVKIYKKEGYDWANKKIRFYIGNTHDEVVIISDAATFNLVGGKVEKTKLKSEGEFIENVNKDWSQKKITMPNVKEGSVVEYQYVLKSRYIGSFNDWNFQNSIPVNYSEYKTYIPEYFIYNTNQKGYIFPNVTAEKKDKTVTFSNVKRDRPLSAGHASGDVSYEDEKLNYEETITTYIAENLPALKEEAFVNNMDNYLSSVSYELSVINYPNEVQKNYSTDWNSLVKTIYDYEEFGQELNKTGYFEGDFKTLDFKENTIAEKISTLFNYVKSNIKWNNDYGYLCKDGVKKAYKDKTGNVAEINLILTAMLRHAGLTANPVLVSTRGNGIALFPSRTAFDYVITAVETPEGLILMDATEKYSLPNVLPLRDLNWFGRLLRKDGTSVEVDLMPKNVSTDYVMMTYSIDGSGKIDGKLRRQRTDHSAMIFRNKFLNVKEDAYLEKLENENQNIDIIDYSMTNGKDIQLPVLENFSFTGSNLCELIGGKIYVNPMLFFTNEHSPFKQETREFPVDFGFPFLDKFAINIQVPEGYEIESLPAQALINMDDNLGSFNFKVSVAGNVIQLSITNQINESIVSSDYYSVLKEYYQVMIAKQTEKIVLKKA